MAVNATPGGHCSIMINMDATSIDAVFNNPGPTPTRRTDAGGLGLIGATERVQVLGGQLQTRAGDTQWEVAVKVPAASDPEPSHG